MATQSAKIPASRQPVYLPAAILALAFALTQTWFFTSLDGGGTAFWGAVIPTALYSFYFWMMLRSPRPAFWRRAFFVTIALVFFPSFIANLVDSRGTMAVTQATIQGSENPFCHIAFTMTLIPQFLQAGFIYPAQMSRGYASVMSMLIIWLLASLTLGRGWCAWVCFYGGWDDGMSRLSKKPRLNLQTPAPEVEWLSFVVLGFVVLASMASLVAVYCEWLCPFKMITEYAAITSVSSYLAAILFICAFAGLVILLPALSRKRFQCSSFCPFGALQSLLDRISPFGMAIRHDTCTGCQACVRACPTWALKPATITQKQPHPASTCVKCGDCSDACPTGAISLQFRRGSQKEKLGPPPVLAEQAAGLSAAIPRPQKRGCGISASIPGPRRFFQAILSPRLLFVTTAYTLGMIVSSGFAQGTFTRFLNLLIHGSFSLLQKGGQP